MGFDLDGKLRIDYSDLDNMEAEIKARTEGVDAKAKVDVDTREAEGNLSDLSGSAASLTDALGKKQTVNVDTAEAEAKLQGLSGQYTKFLDAITSTRALVGLGMMAGGATLAGGIISGSMQSASLEKMSEKSTKLVFGRAAAEYEKQAKDLADSTGFMSSELQNAQVSLNKMVMAITAQDEAARAANQSMNAQPLDRNLGTGSIRPLTQLATDLAANTGLPQYANDIQAVTKAIVSGIEGADSALLDFGIRMDELYVLSLPVNAQFKALGEAITPAQMAQARYNALMEQTAKIYGTASDAAGTGMRKFHEHMQDVKADVGEVLLPIANAVTGFIGNLPKPVLIVGLNAALAIGLGTAIGGAIIFAGALKRAIADLGTTSATAAAQVESAALAQKTAGGASGAAGAGGMGKLAGVATKASIALMGLTIAYEAATMTWNAVTAALQKPKQQASLQDIYAQIGQRRTLALKGGGWTPTTAQERADLVQLYGQPAKGGLSADQVNAAIDAAEAQALMTLQSSGRMSKETAQYFAQQLQQGMDARAKQQALMTSPGAAAQQTLSIIINNNTDAVVTTDTDSYAPSSY